MCQKRFRAVAATVGVLVAVTFIPAESAAPPLGMGQVVISAE
jgi:hypothetical protein